MLRLKGGISCIEARKTQQRLNVKKEKALFYWIEDLDC